MCLCILQYTCVLHTYVQYVCCVHHVCFLIMLVQDLCNFYVRNVPPSSSPSPGSVESLSGAVLFATLVHRRFCSSLHCMYTLWTTALKAYSATCLHTYALPVRGTALYFFHLPNVFLPLLLSVWSVVTPCHSPLHTSLTLH